MEFYEKEDRDLSILGCLWHLIEHWRLVLLSAVIFSVLFGSLKYVKDSRELQEIAKNSQLHTSSVSDIKKRMEMFSGSQKDNIEMAAKLVDAMIETKLYAENSSVMCLDPYNVDRVILQYTVKADKNRLELLHAYKNRILTEKSKEEIVAASGNSISMDDVEDMIAINDSENMLLSKNKGNVSYNGISEIEGADKDEKSVIYFTIRGTNKENAANMAKAVKEIINDYSAEALQLKGVHELVLVSENILQGRDQSIVDLKNDTYKNLFDLNEKIKVLKASMDGEQVNLIEDYQIALTSGSDVNEAIQNNENIVEDTVSLSKIWILLGLIFGVAVSFGIEVMWWFEGGKLNYAEELQHDFNITILGTLAKRKKYKIFGFVDDWIYKIKNRNINILTKEQEYYIILSRILLKAKKENIQEIYLIGSVPECFVDNSIVLRLTEELIKEGVTLIKGNHIGYDSETLLKVSDVGCVIIWEETGVSKYQEIIREVMICKEQDVNILGGIVLCND